MSGWDEARHVVVEFLGTFLSFGLLWFLVGILSFAYLFPGDLFPGAQGTRLIGPVLLGEVVAVFLFAGARRSQLRPRHLVHSVRRISRPSDPREVVARIQELMEIVRRLMVARLGPKQYEAFLLKPLHEALLSKTQRREPDLAEEKMPETYRQLARAVVLDSADRIQKETRPWPSLEPLLRPMEEAVGGETGTDAIREVLTGAYLAANSWYRRASVNPRPGAAARFVDRHPRIIEIIALLLVPLASIAVGLLA
jgi:hypothetical protein